MGIDTYIVIPASEPAGARKKLGPVLRVSTGGPDYLVIYLPDRFSEVEEEPERFGLQLVAMMPRALRAQLDPRGLAAYPEVGQIYEEPSYEALLARQGEPLWLPTHRAPRKRRTVRALLVALSASHREMLLAAPERVKALVASHPAEPIPRSLAIEPWIELQRTLFDAMMLSGGSAEDRRPEAVAPRGGLPLYEDKTVDAAKLVRAEDVAETAAWLASLPDDTVTGVRELPTRSPRATLFPASLGTCPADDDAPSRKRGAPPERRRPEAARLDDALHQLVGFYAEAASRGESMLAVRYRG